MHSCISIQRVSVVFISKQLKNLSYKSPKSYNAVVTQSRIISDIVEKGFRVEKKQELIIRYLIQLSELLLYFLFFTLGFWKIGHRRFSPKEAFLGLMTWHFRICNRISKESVQYIFFAVLCLASFQTFRTSCRSTLSDFINYIVNTSPFLLPYID